MEIIGQGNLLIKNVSPSDSGKYICQIENKNGHTSGIISVTVHEPPKITRPLEPLSVPEKTPVSFECLSNSKDVKFFWFKNGKLISNGVRPVKGQ